MWNDMWNDILCEGWQSEKAVCWTTHVIRHPGKHKIMETVKDGDYQAFGEEVESEKYGKFLS